MAADYWQRIESELRRFTRKGDGLRLVTAYRAAEAVTCELCGHWPIKDVFVLGNSRTNETLKIGGQCVLRYRDVFQRLYGYRPEIACDPRLRTPGEAINRMCPGCVKFDDGDPRDRDVQDLAPGGTGCDEIDWDSCDWERE